MGLTNFILTCEKDNEELKRDINYYKNKASRLEKENQELKKQIEEKDILIKQCELSVSNVMDCYCERTDCSGRIKDSKVYDSLVQKVETQQKEFILYLRHLSNWYSADGVKQGMVNEILQKYKEITGTTNE